MNEEIRQRTKWFMEDRFGMFIHWGLYSIPACGEWMMSQKEMTIEEYSKYFDQFDPVDCHCYHRCHSLYCRRLLSSRHLHLHRCGACCVHSVWTEGEGVRGLVVV